MPEVQNAGEIYSCDICGNVVEVLEAGGGELVCCQKAMTLQTNKKEK
jgi:desulfoferrodoxin-like iron-binding protein